MTDDHKDTVRREFTRQAAAYAANPTIADRERVDRLIALVQPDPDPHPASLRSAVPLPPGGRGEKIPALPLSPLGEGARTDSQ